MPPAGQPDELAAALQREQQACGGGEQEVQQGSGGGDLLLAKEQQQQQQQAEAGQAQARAEAEAERGGKIDKENNIDAGAQADSSEAPSGPPDEAAEEGSRKRQKRTARQRKVRFDPMWGAAHAMM